MTAPSLSLDSSFQTILHTTSSLPWSLSPDSLLDISTINKYFAECDAKAKILREMLKLETEILKQSQLQAIQVNELIQYDFDLLLNQYIQVLCIIEQEQDERDGENQEESITANTGSTTCYERTAEQHDINRPDKTGSDEDKTTTSETGETHNFKTLYQGGRGLKPARPVLYVPTKRIEWKLREDFLYPFYKRVHPKRPILLSKSRNYHPFGFTFEEIESCRESWGCEPIPSEKRNRKSRKWWKKNS